MRYMPIRCDLHGWLLIDPDAISVDNPVIECEGHLLSAKNVRTVLLIETTEYLPKTRGLTDSEFNALKRRTMGEYVM